MWRRLDTNQVDMAIIYLPDNAKKEDTNLRHQYNYESFYDDKLVILTHKTTVEAGESYPVSRFVNRKWVAYPDNFYLNPLMHGYFGKKNKPIIPIKIGSTKELIKMAENSDYDTFITQSYYDAHRDEIDSTNLTPIYLKEEHGFTISYVYRKGKLEIPRMQNLLKEWEKFLDKHQNFSKLLVDQIKS